jgi:hypothetical protein
MHAPTILHGGSMERQSSKQVADGIIQSAMLTPFQRHAIEGMVNSGIPEHRRSDGAVETHSVKPSRTHQDIGAVHYPGSPGVGSRGSGKKSAVTGHRATEHDLAGAKAKHAKMHG